MSLVCGGEAKNTGNPCGRVLARSTVGFLRFCRSVGYEVDKVVCVTIILPGSREFQRGVGEVPELLSTCGGMCNCRWRPSS